MFVHLVAARRDLRAAAITALVFTAACSEGNTPLPVEPTTNTDPIAVWSATPRVLDGKSYRVLEMRQPLHLQPLVERGKILVGDDAQARLALLRRAAGMVAATDHATLSTSGNEGLSLLGSSFVSIDNTLANFVTASTINVTDPANYRLGLLSLSVEHSVDKVGQAQTTPFSRQFKHGTNEDARIQQLVTAWPSIDIGARCPVSAAERAEHHLDAGKIDFWRFETLDPRKVGSTGFAEAQRPCFDGPDEFCNASEHCGDNDTNGAPQGTGGSGAGTLVSGQVFSPTFGGWSNRYCWVTDQYDSEGRYLGTRVDWCNF